MLDFTSQIKLDSSDQRIYRIFQIGLYVGSFLIGMIILARILFPTEYFTFSFVNFNSSKNTITNPRNLQNESKERGNVGFREELLFNASSVGKFSKAVMELDLEKDSSISSLEVTARKSYQAFMYPEERPAGFRDGTLLAQNGYYFMVSDGKIRQFESLNQVASLGFNKTAFMEVSKEEMSYNGLGFLISAPGYPDGSLFRINGEYYQLNNGKLQKFVSEQAFLTFYDVNQIVEKEGSFLQVYPLSEDLIGFSDGSLVSYADSVFVVKGKEILPIGDNAIFEASGYDWSDVLKASGDEISLYEKGKIFVLSSPHPNGTVFVSQEEGKFYLVQDGAKRWIPTENIRKTWSKQSPILVSERGINTSVQCQLRRDRLDWGGPSYFCEMDINDIGHLIGKDYEFKISFDQEAEVEKIDVSLKRVINKENWQAAKLDLASRIKRNYGN